MIEQIFWLPKKLPRPLPSPLLGSVLDNDLSAKRPQSNREFSCPILVRNLSEWSSMRASDPHCPLLEVGQLLTMLDRTLSFERNSLEAHSERATIPL